MIILIEENVWSCYSDCYSTLHVWRATVANLKKILEMERLLEAFFCVNSGFSLQNLVIASLLVILLRWPAITIVGYRLVAYIIVKLLDLHNIHVQDARDYFVPKNCLLFEILERNLYLLVKFS